MKRVGLLFILCAFIFLPCCVSTDAKSATNSANAEDKVIFEYHIPDEEEPQTIEQTEIPEITSDDITADTSGVTDYYEDEDELYNISDMYSDILYGFAEYNEEDQEGIDLDIDNIHIAKLNISQPVKVEKKNYTSLKTEPSLMQNIYSKYNGAEYSITSMSNRNYKTFGGFSAGTLYNQGIDYGELEQSSGLFSRYEKGRFAFSTAYMRTVNSTNNNYNDNFYITPEVKLSQYLTLKEVLSSDTVKKTKKAEFVVSFNPFGNRDKDRLRFDLGASQTYDDNNNVLKNQFKFSTNFKF